MKKKLITLAILAIMLLSLTSCVTEESSTESDDYISPDTIAELETDIEILEDRVEELEWKLEEVGYALDTLTNGEFYF